MCTVELNRFLVTDKCIIGKVYIDNQFFCYSLERPWLDNKPRISAIPEGGYKCEQYSSKKYPSVVELQNVSGRSKILIHAGNKAKDTKGCILLGDSYSESEGGAVWNSKKTLAKFFKKAGYEFDIEIDGPSIDKDTTTDDIKPNKVKTMALPLLLLAAPFAKIMGKQLTKKAAGVIFAKVKEKTGIDITTKEEAQMAIDQLSPSDLQEIRIEAIKADKAMFLAEMKHGEDLGKTPKDDVVTYSFIAWVSIIMVILFFNADKGIMIINSLILLFGEKYFGLTFMLVCISAVGLRSVASKLVEGFVNKYR